MTCITTRLCVVVSEMSFYSETLLLYIFDYSYFISLHCNVLAIVRVTFVCLYLDSNVQIL